MIISHILRSQSSLPTLLSDGNTLIGKIAFIISLTTKEPHQLTHISLKGLQLKFSNTPTKHLKRILNICSSVTL